MTRENTSSGKAQPEMHIGDSGTKTVARVLSDGKPSSPKVGGKSGMQIKIPAWRDQSRVK